MANVTDTITAMQQDLLAILAHTGNQHSILITDVWMDLQGIKLARVMNPNCPPY